METVKISLTNTTSMYALRLHLDGENFLVPQPSHLALGIAAFVLPFPAQQQT